MVLLLGPRVLAASLYQKYAWPRWPTRYVAGPAISTLCPSWRISGPSFMRSRDIDVWPLELKMLSQVMHTVRNLYSRPDLNFLWPVLEYNRPGWHRPADGMQTVIGRADNNVPWWGVIGPRPTANIIHCVCVCVCWVDNERSGWGNAAGPQAAFCWRKVWDSVACLPAGCRRLPADGAGWHAASAACLRTNHQLVNTIHLHTVTQSCLLIMQPPPLPYPFLALPLPCP